MSNQLYTLSGRSLSPMQQSAKKAIIKGENVVLSAPTGSGKTFAFLVPLAEILSANASGRALVICPTRELVRQNLSVWRELQTGMPPLCLYGGRPMNEETAQLAASEWRILFATPGRLLAHLDVGNLQADRFVALVVDEYDKCLEMGFETEMSAIAGHLAKQTQRVLVSATPLDALPPYLSADKCVKVDFIPPEDEDNRRVRKKAVRIGCNRYKALSGMLCSFQNEATIVFVRQRTDAEALGSQLKNDGFSVSVCHGGQEQPQRERSMFRFRSGCATILVTTNLGARGLDLPQVRNVVQYHLPENADDYTHRIGRTARWESEGTSWLMLDEGEELPEYATSSTEVPLPVGHCEPAAPDRTALYIGLGRRSKVSRGDILGWLCKCGGATPADVGTIEVVAAASYVAVRNVAVSQLLKNLRGTKIKGNRTIIEILRN